MTYKAIPFSSLPLDPNGPSGNAWGRFGATDQLGTLNLLTPAVVAAAARSIQTGVRISLDWPLNKPAFPSYGRKPIQHEIQARGHIDRLVNDDVVTFNTQISSQWDGMRHYGSCLQHLVMTISIHLSDTWLMKRRLQGCQKILQ